MPLPTPKAEWRLFFLAWLLIAAGSLLAHFIQTSGNIQIKDIRFTDTGGRTLSALLYIPANASAETPAPGILAVHGYINSREVQSGFAIEFARRGYVVLALDQGGHGYSEAPAFAAGFGGPAGLRYLRSLDIVDTDNIGLEGHSMGGWTILAAATAYPDAYRAMVLEGSSVGGGRSAPGTAEWPRNLAVVFSRYDEFANTMWGVERALDIADSSRLKELFSTDSSIVPGRIYGDIAAGTARVLHSPPVTHPGDHISHTAIGHAIDWFEQTLDGGHPAQVNGQIWFFKELGTLTALLGFVLLLMGSFAVLLNTGKFKHLRTEPDSFAYDSRTGKWWLSATLSAIIPVLTFYPLFSWGAQLWPVSSIWPQSISNQVAFWAIVNALLLSGLGMVLRARKVSLRQQLLPSVQLALATVAIAYVAVLLADFLFKTDFRFWFVGVKRMSLDQFQMFLFYLPLFTFFFILALRALHAGLSIKADKTSSQYLSNCLVLMGGFLAFLSAQYISLFASGQLLTPSEPLNTIVMIQFVPLLLIVGLVSTYCWRRTASHLPGALINALWVSWYLVAGQATQFA
ncbi:MAG: alpha/beta fold hydrolase [Pseudomonadales bacterium]|nr:alpha/beta fold hydrolase [Pseudomonadales bacterium]